MRDKIKEAFTTPSGRWNQKRIHAEENKQLRELISSLYPDASIDEAIWLSYYNQNTPHCGHCNVKMVFKSLKDGYGGKYCSNKCGGKASRAQVEKTNLQKYGSTNPFGFGTEKHKETILTKYGVENVFQHEDVKSKIKRTHLEKRGVDSWAKTPTARDAVGERLQNDWISSKRKYTNVVRYGCETPLGNKNIIEKTKCTVASKYGTDNVSKVPHILVAQQQSKSSKYKKNKLESLKGVVSLVSSAEDWLNKNSLLEWKCVGCDENFFSNLDDGKIPTCRKCHPRNKSVQQQEVLDFVRSLGVEAIDENTRSVISPLEIDIWCPREKIGIEFCGLYWHSEIYKTDKQYHKIKADLAEKHNIRIIQIFSDEWENKNEIVKSRISSLFGKAQKIYARKTMLRQIDNATAKKFFDENHIQGYVIAKMHLGLFYGDDLIAAASFGKCRWDRNFNELFRFCSAKNTTVVGGLSKLISAWLETDNTQFLSYCDRRWGDGHGYYASGFIELRRTEPGYFYTDFKNRYSRTIFQKHKLANKLPNYDENLTEVENMNNNKFYRIWDAGNLVMCYNGTSVK
jgi:hypothetical protein